jgi:hypothetical protein
MNRHLLPVVPVCLFLAACQHTQNGGMVLVETDANRDGRVTVAEVESFVLPRAFGAFDTNRDGVVTLAEARKVEPQFDEALFVERDKNRDGKVTFAEFRTAARKAGYVTKYFKAVDRNGDGVIVAAEANAFANENRGTR